MSKRQTLFEKADAFGARQLGLARMQYGHPKRVLALIGLVARLGYLAGYRNARRTKP